jgi:hypothetical protein
MLFSRCGQDGPANTTPWPPEPGTADQTKDRKLLPRTLPTGVAVIEDADLASIAGSIVMVNVPIKPNVPVASPPHPPC